MTPFCILFFVAMYTGNIFAVNYRPKVHLFGHVHEFNEHVIRDGILFSNAVMKGFVPAKSRVIDYYVTDRESRPTE